MKADSDPAFVVDASVAVAWVRPTQANEYTDSALKIFDAGGTGHAPSLWSVEVANALLVLLRRGKLTEGERLTALQRLSKLPVNLDHNGASEAFTRISDLARKYGLSAYDTMYLDLALRLGLPLACKDGPLRNAAAHAGVALWRPTGS
jgi:predicted nucleic acid-binding protein